MSDFWTSFVKTSPLGIVVDLDVLADPIAEGDNGFGLSPELRDALDRLSHARGVTVAVRTRRAQAVVDAALSTLPRVLAAAERGVWLKDAKGWRPCPARHPEHLEQLASALKPIAASFGGARVEKRLGSVLVHYGAVDPRARPHLVAQLERSIDRFRLKRRGFDQRTGVDAIEIESPSIDSCGVLSMLREQTGESGNIIVLIDGTAETSFLKGLGPSDVAIAVRSAAPCSLNWRLAAISQLGPFLSRVWSAREGHSLERSAFVHEVVPLPVVKSGAALAVAGRVRGAD